MESPLSEVYAWMRGSRILLYIVTIASILIRQCQCLISNETRTDPKTRGRMKDLSIFVFCSYLSFLLTDFCDILYVCVCVCARVCVCVCDGEGAIVCLCVGM